MTPAHKNILLLRNFAIIAKELYLSAIYDSSYSSEHAGVLNSILIYANRTLETSEKKAPTEPITELQMFEERLDILELKTLINSWSTKDKIDNKQLILDLYEHVRHLNAINSLMSKETVPVKIQEIDRRRSITTKAIHDLGKRIRTIKPEIL